MEQTPAGAGKTPTTPIQVADLAVAVDGAMRYSAMTVRPARGGMYPLFMPAIKSFINCQNPDFSVDMVALVLLFTQSTGMRSFKQATPLMKPL